MDIRKFIQTVSKYEKDIEILEKFIMRYYINFNSITNIENSKALRSYCLSFKEDLYIKFQDKLTYYFKKNGINTFTIDMLVNIFELLIPADERKSNGMVFTPLHIKEFIIKEVLKNNHKQVDKLRICDPACGSSSFLITMSRYLKKNHGITYEYIIENIIYGIDIYPHNIDKSKLLLNLIAIEDGEILKDDIKYNLIVGNSLDFNYKDAFREIFQGQSRGFDLVIGNPPYIRAKNISLDIKETLNNWEVSKVGNTDLYISFFQLGLEILNKDGILGYISVNTYLTSLNGRNLRNYLSSKDYSIKIINFKDTQMFKGVTSYTCINIINKSLGGEEISYVSLEELEEYKERDLNSIPISSLDNKQGWNLAEKDIIKNIDKMRRFKTKLSEYGLKNGIATLKNDLYIVSPYCIDDKYLYFKDRSNNNWILEKDICKRIVKPNILKNEADILKKMEYIIFPYNLDESKKNKVIEEEVLEKKYPNVYKYFKYYKPELLERDKGKAIDKYPVWYAFGRTQGMLNFGKKILIPYMAGGPTAILSLDEDILYYCGYALFSDSITELELLKKILLSDVFWYYVKNTSKPYSKGFMSLAKNYVKDFSLPEFTKEQEYNIIKKMDQKQVNKLLREIYDVTLDH